MTDTGTINSLTAAAQTTPTRANTAKASAALSSDFETFLQMLTAQARYQDPLEPLDSSEYASQLAQFSSVEQQVLTNDLLESMYTQNSTSNLAQLATWIGMDARTSAHVYFDQTPITLTPKPASAAEKAHLVVYDQSDTEIQRISIPLDQEEVLWAGVDAKGTPFDPALYRFEVESFAQDRLIATSRLEAYSKVVETRLSGGDTVLLLEGGAVVASSDITALRQAQ